MFLTLTVTTNVWGAYEKASSIAVGDVVVLVYENEKKELEGISTTSTKYGIGVSYTTTPAGAYELTVEAGSTSGTYSFKCPNGQYLYWSSGNSLATNASKSANSSWKVTFSGGNAAILNAKDNTRKLQWNASSPRFACYTTNQTAVQLYKKSASYTVNWTINPAAGGTLSATTGNSITVTPDAAYTYGSPAYTVISGNATVTQNTNTFTANPTTNCTIRINMVQKTTANITFENMGSPAPTTTGYYVGDTYQLPSENDFTCGSKTFVGWSTVEISNSSDKPTSNFYEPGATITLKENQTFYAVFAEQGGLSEENEVLLDYKGGTSTDLSNTDGLSVYGNGSDYTDSHSYYRVKLDDTGDYILYTNESQPYISRVLFKVKMIGGKSSSIITIRTSNDGTNYTEKSLCNISGEQNSVNTYTVDINTSAKYLQFYFTKGSNIGFGPLFIYTKSTSYQNYTTECAQTDCSLLSFASNIAANQTAAYAQNATANTLTVSAAYDGNSTGVTYQWYSNTTNSNTNGTLITNATSASYKPSTTEVGTTYYYCEATYDECTITSNVATVVVNPTYTVTFDSDGGSAVTGQTIEKGKTATKPENPEKAGHTFIGWYNGDTEFDFNTPITDDITLKAKWTINQYKVTLNPNYPEGKTGTLKDKDGNIVSGNLVLTYDYNTSSMLLTDLYQSIELEGYQFNGWFSAISGGSKWTSTSTITKDVTVYAQWSKLYTITFSENGTTTTPTSQTSASYTLPTELSVGTCENDEKELVGWSTVAIPTPGDKPTSNYYELGATVTLTTDQTTFYAVFATPTTIPGGTEKKEETTTLNFSAQGYGNGEEVTSLTIDDVTVTFNKGSNKNTPKYYDTGTAVRVYGGGYFTVSGVNLAKIVITTSSGDDGNAISADCGAYDTDTKTWTGSAQSVKFTIGGTTGHRRIKSIAVTYTTTVQADDIFSFSDYTTACEAIPDPVWGGAVINRNSIQVDCGSMTKLNAADPDGPATISFPVATNHTLTYDITVTASEGFLVSTNKTDAAKYGASVTVSPNKTGDNAGKITQNVYVVAVAPAMSGEDFTGTITLSGKQLAENQVINVTADVTCTQYTLTLVDRGVSTEQATKYYAGETIDEAPADPEGVCTDPIHYVFDGWAETTVTNGSTGYTPVSFPYTVTGNTKFYAVYRYVEEGSADSGDYVKVTEDLDDYSGDYLIVYETGSVAFDGGLDELDEVENTISVTINSNTIESHATTDAAKFTIAKVDGGYSIKSTSGYYIGWSTADKNGLNSNSKYSANYYLNTISNSIVSGVKGTLKFNKTSGQERFRYYQSGQEAIALYRKAASYLYTTSPVCGPHLVITEGKDIYVMGGNAGGTRDLVIAQQKVSYKATRLQTSNGLADGTAPDVKVATNGITVGGVVTSDVKVTIDQTKEQQTDGTYTITGTITVQYQPSANNKQEDIQVQLAVDYNADARDNFTVHARSLPAEFVIVAKSGDKWYALNGDMNNGSSANPANGQVTLDDDANPTEAIYAPCNAIYTFDGLPNTGDRTYVRFQGTDGAWLWASSGTNVGIQNNVLKTTPEGSNKAYNWKLYTEDNITYRFGNANSSRQLTLNGEKFGMYASGVQDIRILPYVEKCLYNYAPTNLKVSVLKGTYVTLTWDAVAGATKYQYSTDATNWTDAGTEPTVTINDLRGATEYTYYIRAYHEDAGVSQECIDYAEITFTTADCDDVPTDITYTADLNSITVSWTAAAPTATIKLFMDEEGAHMADSYPGATSPCRISGGLNKNTTYYIQILAGGTCASPIIPVKTEDVEVDIVEWQPQGIIVDINTDETIGVTLENEVSYGSGLGTEATELFFSKYYEASYNVKLVAIYNCTKNIIDLTDYTIQYGKTSWESNYITLKDFGATKGQIQPGEEIILYSYTENNADDKKILDCVHDAFPDGNWVRVTSANNEGKGTLSFGGDKTIILCKTEYDDEADEYYDNIIDVIGALIEDPNDGILPTNENTERPSWGDKEGWVCETGLSIADDSQIGISTNRCLLVRNNTVTSGLDAVAQNIEGDFVTLCSEWKGAQVPDSDIDNGLAASCENFAYVGTFDYSDYYTKYVPMGEGTTFDENARNADGTVTIPITDLYKYACSHIRVKLSNSNGDVLTDREYKVPIMITSPQGTNGQTFLDLQQNLATKEVDGDGNVINTHPLSLEEVREICKTCDVVVRDNATLTKVTDGTTNDHPQVHDVIVYEGASIVIPDGTNHNYTINSLSLRRKGDDVASAQVQGTGKLVLPTDVPVSSNMRIDANNWHWFTLPYNCDIADVTWSDGTPAKYNTDWFLMYYDGESRAASTNPHDNHWKVYSGTTIEAGKGYIIGITGDLAHPDYTFELRFPMDQDVLTAEQTNKTVALNAWGVQSDNTPNNKGWNLVGNPYLNYYQPETGGFSGLSLLQYTGIDPVTGDRLYVKNGEIPFLVTPIDGGWYEYQQELASDVQMMPFTAYFVQVGDPGNPDHTDGKELNASFEASNRGKKSILHRAQSEVDELEDPAIVAVSLTNAKGESDKTTLLIADRFTNEYEMNADFFKWFGDYYKYYTKPVLYTIGADQGKRAFNALNEDLATQPISLGMYAAQAGNYTFSLNLRNELAQVQEVWLYDATQDVYTNLLQDDYTFHTAKTESAGRFFLSVKMAPKVTTDTENLTSGSIWATTHNKTITINGLLSNSNVWVYDATGKLLHADQTQYFQHSFSVPQTGAYFVRVQNTMQTQTIKVVVE